MRLFVAIPVPNQTSLYLSMYRPRTAGARPVPPENMHLTMAFLGDVEPNRLKRLSSGLSRVANPSFKLNLQGIGVFERRGQVSTVWAGLKETPPELERLHECVQKVVIHAGIATERQRFRPHITLARCGRGVMSGAIHYEVANMPPLETTFGVDRFHLMQSELRPEGAKYRVVESYVLN